jgi:hypothetical protein
MMKPVENAKNAANIEIRPKPIVKKVIGILEKLISILSSRTAAFLVSEAIDGSSNTDKTDSKPTSKTLPFI